MGQKKETEEGKRTTKGAKGDGGYKGVPALCDWECNDLKKGVQPFPLVNNKTCVPIAANNPRRKGCLILSAVMLEIPRGCVKTSW